MEQDDEVLIFNRTLSSGEVSDLYNSSKLDANKNHTFTETFSDTVHNIDWLIGCYDDLGIQWNSSVFNLEVSKQVNMSVPNIGSHAYVDDYVVAQWRFEERAVDET